MKKASLHGAPSFPPSPLSCCLINDDSSFPSLNHNGSPQNVYTLLAPCPTPFKIHWKVRNEGRVRSGQTLALLSKVEPTVSVVGMFDSKSKGSPTSNKQIRVTSPSNGKLLNRRYNSGDTIDDRCAGKTSEN